MYTFFVGIDKGRCYIYPLEEVGNPETFAKEHGFPAFFLFTSSSQFFHEYFRLLNYLHRKTRVEMGDALMEFLGDFGEAIVENAENIRETR